MASIDTPEGCVPTTTRSRIPISHKPADLFAVPTDVQRAAEDAAAAVVVKYSRKDMQVIFA